MSPILVRPVREQLEHDRIIRLLHAKFRRKYDAAMNPGVEQNVAVGTGPMALFPDLVLMSQDRGHRVEAIVEVETGESVNHLEALAQWAHYSKLRAAFHLYVPAGMVDVARRLTEDNHINATEIWSYLVVGDQPRFTLVHRSREAPTGVRVKAVVVSANRPPKPVVAAPPPPPVEIAPTPAAKPAVKPVVKAVVKPVAKPVVKPVAKPVAKAKPAVKAKPPARTAKPKKAAKPARPTKTAKATPAKSAKKKKK